MGEQVAARSNGDVAQLGEHLPCKQGVESSVWESRWLPDQKERNRRSCLIKIERALESELCRKQSGTRRFSISPVLTLNQSGRTVIIAGFYQ